MKKDRLRNDTDKIRKLEDLIEARDQITSHIGEDIDSFEKDIDIPEDTDVDEALTFPHPKHRKIEEIDLMDTPHKDNLDEDWEDQDVLPSDYAHGYNEATTTDPRDDFDETVEDDMQTISHVTADQVSDEPSIEVMPDKFTPDEETKE